MIAFACVLSRRVTLRGGPTHLGKSLSWESCWVASRIPASTTCGVAWKRSPERLADGKGAEFVIADARTDEFVGAVNLFALDWHSRRGEVGYLAASAGSWSWLGIGRAGVDARLGV